MDNVNLEDSEIDPEEYREPFMQKLPRRRRFGPGVNMPRVMKLSKMGLVKVSEPLVHCMRIDEKELMAWCRQHDATPNVTIAVMMNRAIHNLHPDSKLPIGTYGSCDKHIRGLYPETNCGYEMVIETTVAGGYFLLDISQMWKEDVYNQRCTLLEI